VAEKLLDHVDGHTGLGQLGPRRMAEHMGPDRAGQPRPTPKAPNSWRTAEPVIGAPNGAWNMLTNTKSQSSAAAHPSLSCR
jgi:hypothetical protein